MKQIINKPADINKIEFWAVTTMFVFSIFFLVSGSINQNWVPNKGLFRESLQQYSYFDNYFIPTLFRYAVFYGSYLLLTLLIIPPLSRKENIAKNIIYIHVIFYFISVSMGTTDTWIKGYLFDQYPDEDLYTKLFQDNIMYSFWLMIMFAFYTAIKYVAIYLLENSDLIQSEYRVITRDGIYAFILWMIGLFLLLIGNADEGAVIVIAICTLMGITIYCYSIYNLIPQVYKKGKTFKAYFWKLAGITVISVIPLSLFSLIFNHRNDPEIAIAVSLFNIAFQLLITGPLSWYLYKQRLTANYEIIGLKTALGHSNANLNFLRSQINPHFLFNILNSLYGTALQERSERTADGIQRLGDMMRFMLHENMQEKISLTREIEYLNNYIALQTLRTQTSPDITIQSEIEEHMGNLQIAPMLLIPFVENAFKHGISLKESSGIRISLLCKDKSLYFDVSNSIHAKNSNDPESEKNGIGLNNVQQRLRLLYPGKHELTIRENGKEFFIHLTIQLD
ncbi:Histidine kinase [Daejeonella rubra]|uniref:Histidine kinase n=1 Tax=Daejeonella rubra TaxID=990371 RepID=A0A1G9X880_9SPHI|nr:histidine kinase [Daejeonella rubra]SDM92857.1 Histidine kinase [Daejeonella rubra]